MLALLLRNAVFLSPARLTQRALTGGTCSTACSRGGSRGWSRSPPFMTWRTPGAQVGCGALILNILARQSSCGGGSEPAVTCPVGAAAHPTDRHSTHTTAPPPLPCHPPADLAGWLRQRGVHTVLVCGVATEYCVRVRVWGSVCCLGLAGRCVLRPCKLSRICSGALFEACFEHDRPLTRSSTFSCSTGHCAGQLGGRLPDRAAHRCGSVGTVHTPGCSPSVGLRLCRRAARFVG